jgi:hypothetical protein
MFWLIKLSPDICLVYIPMNMSGSIPTLASVYMLEYWFLIDI